MHEAEAKAIRRVPREQAEVEIELARRPSRCRRVRSWPLWLQTSRPACTSGQRAYAVVAEQREHAAIEEERQAPRSAAEQHERHAILGRSDGGARADQRSGGKSANREGLSAFADRVAGNDLDGVAAHAADGVVAVRVVVGPADGAAEREHVVREARAGRATCRAAADADRAQARRPGRRSVRCADGRAA